MIERAETNYPERIIPNETVPGIIALHLKRYNFAAPFCQEKVVLDAACGVGYGTAYLARKAKQVYGVEIDAESIRYAEQNYAAANIIFKNMNATQLAFPESFFDTICSFETIEHLQDIDAYLLEVVRVLKRDGVYFVSTPQVKETTLHPENPFHTIEFSKRDFESLLQKYFETVDFYGQRRLQTSLHSFLQKLDFLNLRSKLIPKFIVKRAAKALKTTPIDELSFEDIVITKDKLNQASEFVVVCREPKKNIRT